MIELEQASFAYKSKRALYIERLSIENGRRVALVGANGSGKSTLLKLLCGQLQPCGGRIEYTEELKPHERGYMPQRPYAFSLSVLENVKLGLSADMLKTEADELARKTLAGLGMLEFEAQRGNRLSGGEMQRMALARLLVLRRRLLLLDEPTSATDINGTGLVEEFLSEYLIESGATLVFATHSLTQASRMADLIVLLDKGVIAETGTPERLLESPESEAGRAFLRHWRI